MLRFLPLAALALLLVGCESSPDVLDTIPDDAGYENTRPYDARGWCSFERQMSTIVKHQYCAWDVRMHVCACGYG